MFEVASTDLVNMGVMIISYTIKDITDEVGYLAVSDGVLCLYLELNLYIFFKLGDYNWYTK